MLRIPYHLTVTTQVTSRLVLLKSTRTLSTISNSIQLLTMPLALVTIESSLSSVVIMETILHLWMHSLVSEPQITEATWQQFLGAANPPQIVPLTLSTNLRLTLEASSLMVEVRCREYQMVLMATELNIIQVSCLWEKIAIISVPILTPQLQDSITLNRPLKPNHQTTWEIPRRASWTTSRRIALSKLANKSSRIISFYQRQVPTIREWWRLSTTQSNRHLDQPELVPDRQQRRQEGVASPISSQDRVEIATGAVSTTCESNW